MFHTMPYSQNRSEAYHELLSQLHALSADVNDDIAILANASALLSGFLSEINWVGFYLWKNGRLVLGPFQGKPACVLIEAGKGVCGTAAATRLTQRIPNVHEFPGHIACDEVSKSEIVIPMVIEDNLYGVLDIDAPIYDRFDEIDKQGLEHFVRVLVSYLGNQ